MKVIIMDILEKLEDVAIHMENAAFHLKEAMSSYLEAKKIEQSR